MVSCGITLRLRRASRTKAFLHLLFAEELSALFARLVIFVAAAIADLKFSSMVVYAGHIRIPEIYIAMWATGIMFA